LSSIAIILSEWHAKAITQLFAQTSERMIIAWKNEGRDAQRADNKVKLGKTLIDSSGEFK
jgi:hypothetical protein